MTDTELSSSGINSLIRSGKTAWNSWRQTSGRLRLDLTRIELPHTNLNEFDLSNVCLFRANLQGSSLWKTNLAGSDITEANLRGTNLRRTELADAIAVRANISRAVCWRANFERANLHMADFWGSDLSDATLANANLTEARLHGTILVRANLECADLSRAMVYGSSAWDAQMKGASQRDLVITPDAGRQKWHGYDRMEVAGPVMTVDDIEVAQFIYLLVNNAKVRQVLDTITSKFVLILGRFTPERKSVLDDLRNALREHDLVPILFDFEKPSDRDFTETVSTIGHLARFVIADLTDPRSVPQELQRLVPNLPSVPIQPIIQEGQSPYSMFPDFGAYLSVMPPLRYRDSAHLQAILRSSVIEPAKLKSEEIAARRNAYSKSLSA